MLPTQIGEATVVRHSVVGRGAALPRGIDTDQIRALLDFAHASPGDVAIANLEPATASGVDPLMRLSVVAIRIRGADRPGLAAAFLDHEVGMPGFRGKLSVDDTTGGRRMVVQGARPFTVYDVGDVLFVIALPDLAYLATFSQSDVDRFQRVVTAVLNGLPPPRPALSLKFPPGFLPSPTPAPTDIPDPDLELAARMPTSIAGVPVKVVSARDPLQAGGPLGISLYFASFLGHPARDVSVAIAAGGAGQSSFVVMAFQVRGANALELRAMWWQLSLISLDRDTSTEQVGDRIFTAQDSSAIYAAGDTIYWMTYLDLGDSFGATMAPRPPLIDLVRAAVRAIP
jgi:hypothetical protein